MFNIKRMMSLGLMLLMLSTLLVFTTGVASAHTTSTTLAAATCYDTSCDGKSPVSTGCDSSAITERTATSSDLGGGLKATVYLRYSTACGTAWAKVVFNQPLTYPHGGSATIKRNTDGKSYNCASAGGNGLVSATETSCYSAMVGDVGSTTSFAYAEYYTNEAFHRVATTTSF